MKTTQSPAINSEKIKSELFDLINKYAYWMSNYNKNHHINSMKIIKESKHKILNLLDKIDCKIKITH